MSGGFSLAGWEDLSLAAGVIAVVSTILGVLGQQWATRRRDTRESARQALDAAVDVSEAESAAQRRLVDLIQCEADKKVAIVRAEMELAIANLKADHAREMTALRTDFERQISELKRDAEAYRCDVAPTCRRRHRGTPEADLKAGGTD